MSKLDDILMLSKDNDGEFYTAKDKTDYHDEQKRQIKELMLELINSSQDETPRGKKHAERTLLVLLGKVDELWIHP